MAKTGTNTPDESDNTKTDQNKAKLLEALEKSLGVVTTACRSVNVSRDTHYRWLKEDAEYNRKVTELEEVALDFSESKLHENIEANDTTAIIFHLKTKGKRRGYTERVEFKEVDPFKEKYDDKSPEEIAEDLSGILKKMQDAVS
jgi:predicted site-specific integrase-resolvase